MPELAVPQPGEVIEAGAFGQPVVFRILSRYASAANRDALVPTPASGDFAWLTDTQTMQVYDGNAWIDYIAQGDEVATPLVFVDASDGVVMMWRKAQNTGTIWDWYRIIENANVVPPDDSYGFSLEFGQSNDKFVQPSSWAQFFHIMPTTGDVTAYGEIAAPSITAPGLKAQAADTAEVFFARGTAPFDWRFIVASDGSMLLQSAPTGTTTWTTKDSWTGS